MPIISRPQENDPVQHRHPPHAVLLCRPIHCQSGHARRQSLPRVIDVPPLLPLSPLHLCPTYGRYACGRRIHTGFDQEPFGPAFSAELSGQDEIGWGKDHEGHEAPTRSLWTRRAWNTTAPYTYRLFSRQQGIIRSAASIGSHIPRHKPSRRIGRYAFEGRSHRRPDPYDQRFPFGHDLSPPLLDVWV